jgi:hypothetical protein
VVRRRWAVYGTLAIGLAAAGAWLLADRLRPLPVSLVGVWENETPIGAAGPGEVRVTVSRDGTAVVWFDPARHAFGGEYRYRCRVRGDRVFIRGERQAEPESARIEVGRERFRLWDPASPRPGRDEVVFRRASAP